MMPEKMPKSVHNKHEEGNGLIHHIPEHKGHVAEFTMDLYGYGDLNHIQSMSLPQNTYNLNVSSMDELLDRDKQREKDGFPKKIRLGRFVKPGKGGKDKIIVVPTTVEEKFIHDSRKTEEEKEETSGGSGDGDRTDRDEPGAPGVGWAAERESGLPVAATE